MGSFPLVVLLNGEKPVLKDLFQTNSIYYGMIFQNFKMLVN